MGCVAIHGADEQALATSVFFLPSAMRDGILLMASLMRDFGHQGELAKRAQSLRQAVARVESLAGDPQ